jgi:hypothetical protein
MAPVDAATVQHRREKTIFHYQRGAAIMSEAAAAGGGP